jgi:signal transduction histidine kinase
MWNSLRFRFAAAGLVPVLLFVAFLGFFLQGVHERHAEHAAIEEMQADLRFLTRALRMENGAMALQVDPLPDPRFQEPLSGLYWQVHDDRNGRIERSPSLATFALALPADEFGFGELHRHIVEGPEGSKLIVLERRIPGGNGEKSAFRFAVAIDRKVIAQSYGAFLRELLPVLSLLALGLLLMMTAQAAFALQPLRQVRKALQEVRAGRRDRIGSTAPVELAGLATDFDLLLQEREADLKKARERAADLAHGLKTPLTVLTAKTRDLRQQGDTALADVLDSAISDLDSRLSRELARAQIQGPSRRRQPVSLAPIAQSIADALSRTVSGEKLNWWVDMDAALSIAMERADALELLGALAENAAKWAKAAVRISASGDESCWTIIVDDDGPGISPQNRRVALSRGQGLDPDRSGSGLGLAIVQDIATAYGARVLLDDSPLGGLRVQLSKP